MYTLQGNAVTVLQGLVGEVLTAKSAAVLRSAPTAAADTSTTSTPPGIDGQNTQPQQDQREALVSADWIKQTDADEVP